jgi:hypothetical protein
MILQAQKKLMMRMKMKIKVLNKLAILRNKFSFLYLETKRFLKKIYLMNPIQ